MKTREIENKSPVAIHGLKSGGHLVIKVDQEGTPLDRHWRRRLKDDDGNIVVVENKKVSTKKPEKKEA